jgi:hypothetical protein
MGTEMFYFAESISLVFRSSALEPGDGRWSNELEDEIHRNKETISDPATARTPTTLSVPTALV